jgi:hypothetical protein
VKTIVRRAAAVVTSVGLLGLAFAAPQLRHLERLADLLVMAPRRKALAQLAAQELGGIDPRNLADFFRISPWDADDLRVPALELLLGYLKKHNHGCTEPPYWLIDDSLANKGKGTRQLEAVDGSFDHKCRRLVKASNHVSLSISWGASYFPLLACLYWRRRTVQKRNRKRPSGGKLVSQSKRELARHMLGQVQPLLPPGVAV